MTTSTSAQPGPDVAGEDRVLLAHALAPLLGHARRTPRGLQVEGQVGGPEGEALVRAIMRIEAELLVAEADALGPGDLSRLRSPDARRADALGELIRRLLPADLAGNLEAS